MLHIFCYLFKPKLMVKFCIQDGSWIILCKFLHIKIRIWIKGTVNLIFDSQWNRYSYLVFTQFIIYEWWINTWNGNHQNDVNFEVVDKELVAIGIICMSVINTLDSTHMCYTSKIRRSFWGIITILVLWLCKTSEGKMILAKNITSPMENFVVK
jgi:hypothetical protein